MDDADGRYQHVLENARALIVEIDGEGRLSHVSSTVTEILGYAPEDLVEGAGRRLVHADDRDQLLELFRKLRSSGEGARTELRARHREGNWVWLEATLNLFRTPSGDVRTAIVARDVTALRETAEALRSSEERYRALAENSKDMISEWDGEGRMLWMSPNVETLLGYRVEEFQSGRVDAEGRLVHPEDRPQMLEALGMDLEGRRSGRAEYRIKRADGTWCWVESTARTYRMPDGRVRQVIVSRDVSERVQAAEGRRELEERMRHAQKLESLGVMAGGIAHDFNNLLTPILGDTSLVLLDLPPDSPARTRLKRVQKAAHRAAALTNQMLAYAGEEALHVEVVNLSRLVREMGQLLETAATRESRLTYELEPAPPHIEADPARVSQVVMNLITNASEALTDGGRITLRTGAVELDRSEISRLYLGTDLPSGEYVFVEVSDSGCGMDAPTLTHIFDPFFTTKFTGRGLGLAAVVGIVRAHQGAIDLQSEAGVGTRFRVLFPSTQKRFRKQAADPEDIALWRASGTVLVVDDEEGVREVARDTLERAGLTVLLANDGREGIDLFERHADAIRAVVLDRTMPTASGEEAFAQMRRLRPEAPIILVSGYSEQRASQRFVGSRLDGFLAKPFEPTALLQKVREVLER